MKVLMTNHRLHNLGGTELFVAEIAEALLATGHEVCVFSTVIGGTVAQRLQALQIPVITDPKSCPFQPDIIHGQHHLETLAALCAWPGCPAIYFVHGATPWEETPPRHPRIGRYLGTSPRFAWSIAKTCGVAEDSVIVAPNFFDSRRFTRVRSPGTRSGRALIFHNTMPPDGPAFRALHDACAKAGLRLEGIGHAFGKTVAQPGEILPDYDVVFAAGRSAIEAMACGCAVIPVSAEQAAEWIRPDNFETLAMRNFTAEINAPPVTADHILAELRLINPDQTAEITRRIRAEATIERTIEILVHAYTSVLENPPATNPAAEVSALADYLLSIAEHVKDADNRRASLIAQKDRARARAAKWKSRAEELAARLRTLEAQAAARPWWQRLGWRRKPAEQSDSREAP